MGASNDSVNPQVTDAVTQANVKVLGDAPAMAMGTIFQTLAQSTGMGFQNAVFEQQQNYMASRASTVMGVTTLYAIDVASTAAAEQTINLSDLPGFIAAVNAVT